ncbi:MAG TPA: ferredoxin family protein [Pirellulales bacterium]
MAKKLTVVISQGQSANPIKRKLEEDLVTVLLGEPGLELTVVPHLYDLAPEGTGMLCLQSIAGDMLVASWLFARATHWLLDRNGIRGRPGATLLVQDEADEDDEGEADEAEADARPRVIDSRPLPERKIYCLDLKAYREVQPYADEIRRIRDEHAVQTVTLLGLPAASLSVAAVPSSNVPAPPVAAPPASIMAVLAPDASQRVDEDTARRWYPVIDYSRCTNCLECIDFCLFGVYGIDRVDTILVEQPDNCRKGCPACSRVCPESAIIFPQHKTPAIAGSPVGEAGSLKIDLSKLFGAPDALEVAVLERDVELVAVGRDAVGMQVGIPKRQTQKATAPRDELDALIDELDGLAL